MKAKGQPNIVTDAQGVKKVNSLVIDNANSAVARQTMSCEVINEDALTISVQDIGNYTMMWTPTEAIELPMGYFAELGLEAKHPCPEIIAFTLGFLLTENLIQSLSEVRAVSICPDVQSLVNVTLFAPKASQVIRKDVVMTSSCGICGGRELISNEYKALPVSGNQLTIKAELFAAMMTNLKAQQAVFKQCGGAHAAAVFDDQGKLLVVTEDLGRHNALDKAIGKCLLSNIELKGKGVLLSSRLSLEMVSKAARAGIELIAAVSAPSSLAIEVAERCNITLLGFVRDQRLTCFSHYKRLDMGDNGKLSCQ